MKVQSIYKSFFNNSFLNINYVHRNQWSYAKRYPFKYNTETLKDGYLDHFIINGTNILRNKYAQ